MKEKIGKLIDLKTIISLIVVIGYTAMCFYGIVEADYKDIVLIVLTYYFNRKITENQEEKRE